MKVSSYLEAFLSVYGWEVYGVLFLLLMMTGLFIYPLLRGFIEISIDFFVNDGQTGQSIIFQIIISILLSLMVFFAALVPVVNINFSNMTVVSHCGKAAFSIGDVNRTRAGQYFTNTETRVPMMPWLAMSIGQGINNIFFTNLPCVQDLTETQDAMLVLDFSKADNPAELANEYNRFHNECHLPAVRKIREIRNGDFDKTHGTAGAKGEDGKIQKYLDEQTKIHVKQRRKELGYSFQETQGRWYNLGFIYKSVNADEETFMLEFTDSPLIRDILYKQDNASLPEELKDLPATFRAQKPVEGYEGSIINNEKTDTPSCYDWWYGQNGKEGLRSKILTASKRDLVYKVSSPTGPVECRADLDKTTANENGIVVPIQSPKDLEGCIKSITDVTAGGKGELLDTQILYAQHANHLKTSQLTDGENMALTAAVVTEVEGVLASVWAKTDLSTGLLSSITGFYSTIFILKIILKYLIPFALMTLYMFWGIYMVIGGMRGTTMLKGMFIIIAICIIPGLWAIIDHLDDKLWEAMGQSNWGIFNRAMLDITTGMFYIGIIYVVFFFFNLAGGGDASAAIRGSGGNGMSGELGGRLGDNMGRGTGKISRWSIFGSQKPQTNKETNRREMVPTGGFVGKGIGAGLGKIGSYSKRAWSGMKNGWTKWRGK